MSAPLPPELLQQLPGVVWKLMEVEGMLLFYLLAWLLKERELRKERRREKFQELFDFLRHSYATIGTINPNYRDTIPPDDQQALARSRTLIDSQFAPKEQPLPVTASLDVNQSLYSMGGPVSNILSRYAMGHNPKGRLENAILPYRYDLRGGELSSERVRDPAGKREPEPNWYLVDRNGKRVFDDDPKVEKGTLKTDLLTISVIPNTLTKTAFEGCQRHMIVAGAHGCANKAIAKALSDDLILKKIDKGREGSEFFQAVIRVPKVKILANKYEPVGKLSVFDVKPLDPSDFTNFKNLDEWLH